MTTFAQAVAKTINVTKTENGALTNERSGSSLVDLFFLIGSGSRDPNFESELLRLFERGYADNKKLATRLLLWARDCRGGAGRRSSFRNILKYMEKYHKEDLMYILPYVWNYGRWDDYLIFETPEVKKFAYDIIWSALKQKNTSGLVAKWLPREKSKNGRIAAELRKHMDLDPKTYRKMLSGMTSVVEQKMCAKDWYNIEFGKVPSVAAARYAKAFTRNAKEVFAQYIESLKKGEAKVNAGVIFPHDVINTIKNGNVDFGREQWKALPNFMGDASAIAMVDVSQSMTWLGTGENGRGPKPIDIAVALGLYCADKNTGPFKDVTITFSTEPVLDVLKGDIVQKMNQLQTQKWKNGTDIIKAFEAVLDMAVAQNVSKEDMPKYVLILSDMEFDRCVVGGQDAKAIDAMRDRYAQAGYRLPRIIFWNLMGRSGNMPVTHRENGTALVSGYSPSILKSIFDVDQFTPENVMLKTIMSDRYNIWA